MVTGSINPLTRQQGQRTRVHLPGRLTARTHRPPTGRRQMIEGGFGKDRTARVTRTEEKDVHVSDVPEDENKGGSTASEQPEA